MVTNRCVHLLFSQVVYLWGGTTLDAFLLLSLEFICHHLNRLCPLIPMETHKRLSERSHFLPKKTLIHKYTRDFTNKPHVYTALKSHFVRSRYQTSEVNVTSIENVRPDHESEFMRPFAPANNIIWCERGIHPSLRTLSPSIEFSFVVPHNICCVESLVRSCLWACVSLIMMDSSERS